MFWTQCLCPPHPAPTHSNLSAEALTPSVATFGDGASKDITKVK